MGNVYLVSGGLGFMGSNFIKKVLEKEPESFILNIDKMTYASNSRNLDGIDEEHCLTIESDILDDTLIQSVLDTHRPDYVVHFAAETHVDNSIKDPLIFLKTNVMGTATLINECKKYYEKYPLSLKKFIHISTDEVYGALNYEDSKFNEGTCYNPHSPYAASKAGSDHLVQAYHDTYGLPTIITHSCNNYGPGQYEEKLIPKVINNIVLNKHIPIYGDGEQVRDWIFVDDHNEAVYMILYNGKSGGVYTIGANEEHTNIEIVKMICDFCDKKLGRKKYSNRSLIKFVKDRLGHDFRYGIDASKLRNELGWIPKMSFEKGIETTIEWYLRNIE